MTTSTVIDDAVNAYLDEIDPARTGQPAPDPRTVEYDILTISNQRIEFLNSGLKGPDRTSRLKALTPVQLAEILMRLHHVVRIVPSGMSSNPDYDLLAVYADTGPQEGVYTADDTGIRAVARRYNSQLTLAGAAEMTAVLREHAPRVTRCMDPNLIAMHNGIFHYDTKELTPFDPAYVFLAKNQAELDFNAVSPVIHNDEDGTDWEVLDWIREISDDAGVPELLLQVAGAVMRPMVRWNKSLWFYSEQGNNGKGTFCELLRNLVGPAACASIPLADMGKDFHLEPLTHSSAIVVDENDVGVFIDKAANLKAIVTNDVIAINRKNKSVVDYQFWGLVVQCLNEFPKVKDKSESFYRRQLFVPFTKCFTGRERRYIKDDYLNRPDVLNFVAKYVLVDLPDYRKLDEPAVTQDVLSRFKEENDPVRAWWAENEERFAWDLLPFSFLYDHFKAWFAKTNPSGRIIGKQAFLRDLMPATAASRVFGCEDPNKKIYTGGKMSVPEPMILEYELASWKSPRYAGKDPARMCTPAASANYRGLLRYVSKSTAKTRKSGEGD